MAQQPRWDTLSDCPYWAPYLLGVHDDALAIVNVVTGEHWRLDWIFENWRVIGTELFRLAHASDQAAGIRRQRSVNLSELPQRAAEITALAEGLHFGGGIREQLISAAARLNALPDEQARYFEHAVLDPKGVDERRASLWLWVRDTLTRAATTVRPRYEPLGNWQRKFYRDLLPSEIRDLPAPRFDASVDQRIRRLKIRPGQEIPLMSACLRELIALPITEADSASY